MLRIPLSPIPSQVVNVTLGGQNCEILVVQKTYGLFISVTANRVALVQSKLARNGVALIPANRHGFIGNLVFADSQGQSDPNYEGLANRYRFYYLEKGEV